MKGARNYPVSYRPTRSLTVALHKRDARTSHHCGRVESLAIHLGKSIGLNSSELDILRICARFHDVGKIGIPDSILNKPSRFDRDEWGIMKTHSQMGEQIVRATELPDANRVSTIIRHHHENYAGKGYPDGLNGEDIPLESRVILIVDAYDAMRSTRPNRPKMDHEKVMSIMESENGWKFDPAIFSHFPGIVENWAPSAC